MSAKKVDQDLVLVRDEHAVTTSVRVAESFGKKHQHVMEAIRKLTVENSTVKKMFAESTYVNSRNQTQPMYYMSRDGFTLLAMSFTGDKALQFKLKYINAFNKMEHQIEIMKQLPRTPEEQMLLVMQVSNHTVEQMKKAYKRMDGQDKQIHQVQKDIDEIKNKSEINSAQRYKLEMARKKHVIEIVGGKSSNFYKQKKTRKVFSALFHDLAEEFMVSRYADIAKEQFDDAMKFIREWYPPYPLKQEIDTINAQTSLDV